MISLLLSASLLAGLGTTGRMGESGPAPVLWADVEAGRMHVEAGWDGSRKLETGDGWLANGAADVRVGPLTVGAGIAYRHTGQWTKTRGLARLGFVRGPLWLLASVALASPNEERRIEARYRLRARWLIVEPRAWAGTHRDSERMGGPSWGLSSLIGVAW